MTNNDNNDFYIDYPTNQVITLTLKQFDNYSPLLGVVNTRDLSAGGGTYGLHYVLYLSLEGIEEEISDRLVLENHY